MKRLKARSIRKQLRPSKLADRRTTIAHAFASALAPFDVYDADEVAEALNDLGQSFDADLVCAYCGEPAATWDHVFGRVRDGEFSGYGHRIRNLVPCCRDCNEAKVSKHWRQFLDGRDSPGKDERVRRMECFLAKADPTPSGLHRLRESSPSEVDRYAEIKTQVLHLLAEADALAAIIRARSSAKA